MSRLLQVLLGLGLMACSAMSSIPMPFPLPVNFTFGNCHFGTGSGCAAPMLLAPQIAITCSTEPGCSSTCDTSPFVKQVFALFDARISAESKPTPPVQKQRQQQTHHKQFGGKDHTSSKSSSSYWWQLDNINCNLHDLPLSCDGGTIAKCKTICEAHPTCGGFLYYTKTNTFGVKNNTCWEDIAPLPANDDGDNLYVMHATPQPPPLPQTPGTLTDVEVCFTDSSEDLSISTDESYSVSVPVAKSAKASVKAQTIFGLMRGLETFTQLLDVYSTNHTVKMIPAAPVEISDKPRFPFRGIMIDSGRHFLPLSKVKNIVVAASMVKMNVIHWHLVDATSFPTCSKNFPTLCAQGGYPNVYSARVAGIASPPNDTVKTAIYKPEDLADLVAFAKTLGVRIQPEWDMPGHGSWGMGKPELVTSACSDALDVTKPELYDFLKTFLLEMGTIFTEDFLFLGGDELPTDCFDNSPTIAKWMKDHGLNSSGTQQYFWQQMTAKVFPALNKTISVWRADKVDSGPHINNLPHGSVMNVYQSLNTAWTQTIPNNVKSVVSMAGQKWYLDGECGGYNQNAWTCIYSFNGVSGSWLLNPNWNEQERSLFLGGETALWGEGINEDNFDAFAWRGTAAAAERLWTTEEDLGCLNATCPGITNVRPGPSYWMSAGDPRLAQQLCRMSQMGIKTGPIDPGFCPSDAPPNTANNDAATTRGLRERIQELERQNAMLQQKLSHC